MYASKAPRLFLCDCEGEGCTVGCCDGFATVTDDSFNDHSYISLAFWQQGMKFLFNDKLTFWERIRYASRIIFRGDVGWTDMVCFDRKTARKFAYHILYLTKKK